MPLQENIDEGRNVVHYQDQSGEQSPALENQLASMSVQQGKS